MLMQSMIWLNILVNEAEIYRIFFIFYFINLYILKTYMKNSMHVSEKQLESNFIETYLKEVSGQDGYIKL